MPNRGYQEREIQLAIEWAARAFPGRRVITRYRILRPPAGPIPGFTLQETLQLLKPTGYMVDLVVPMGDDSIIVEAKTDNESAAIGQLLFYRYLMIRYKDLQEVTVKELWPVILLARENPEIEDFATGRGVNVAVYSPPWIQEFLRTGYVGRSLGVSE